MLINYTFPLLHKQDYFKEYICILSVIAQTGLIIII